jgi:hypothetical protein
LTGVKAHRSSCLKARTDGRADAPSFPANFLATVRAKTRPASTPTVCVHFSHQHEKWLIFANLNKSEGCIINALKLWRFNGNYYKTTT